MSVRFDSFDKELVWLLNDDGSDRELVPRVRLYLSGQQVGEYFSYHVADRLDRWGRILGPMPWERPVCFDIRLVRIDGPRKVYSFLPEPLP